VFDSIFDFIIATVLSLMVVCGIATGGLLLVGYSLELIDQKIDQRVRVSCLKPRGVVDEK